MKCSGDTGLGIESFQDINVGVDVEEVDEDDESYDTVEEEELLEQFLLSGISLDTKGATTEIRLPSQTIVSGKFRTAEYNINNLSETLQLLPNGKTLLQFVK